MATTFGPIMPAPARDNFTFDFTAQIGTSWQIVGSVWQCALSDVSGVIDPTPQNGCTKRCYALSHCVATTSAKRVRQTSSRIAEDQLLAIRRQIALAIGLG